MGRKESKAVEGRRITIEIISRSIFAKVWEMAGIELTTTGSAVRLAYVARGVTYGVRKVRFIVFDKSRFYIQDL